MVTSYKHQSVLAEEIIKYLNPQPGQNFIDATLGGGGHADQILARIQPNGKLLGFDIDSHAWRASRLRLAQWTTRVKLVNESYVHLKDIYNKYKSWLGPVSGIVIDLGLSSDQLDRANRGFSFKDEGPLDMRFSPDKQKLTASEIILNWPADKLETIFLEYGEVKQAFGLSQAIVAWRKKLPPKNFIGKQKQKTLKTSALVLAILQILKIKPEELKRFRIHPATQIFQALSIAVNDELGNLEKFLPQAVDILQTGGKLGVISFHSLEDRLVKNYFRKISKNCLCPAESPLCTCGGQNAIIKIVNKKIIIPSLKEVAANPRSRSARLRIVQKI